MSPTLHAALLARMSTAFDAVYDGYVPLDALGRPVEQRYAVLYQSASRRYPAALTGAATEADVYFQVTSVGQSPTQALDVAETCSAALCGWRPDVVGLSCGLVAATASSPTARDDDVPGDLPVFYCVDSYRVTSSRN